MRQQHPQVTLGNHAWHPPQPEHQPLHAQCDMTWLLRVDPRKCARERGQERESASDFERFRAISSDFERFRAREREGERRREGERKRERGREKIKTEIEKKTERLREGGKEVGVVGVNRVADGGSKRKYELWCPGLRAWCMGGRGGGGLRKYL